MAQPKWAKVATLKPEPVKQTQAKQVIKPE